MTPSPVDVWGRRASALLVAGVLGVLSSACHSEDLPLCRDVKQGSHWRIEVLESSPGSGTTATRPEMEECLKGWGVEVGTRFEGEVAFHHGEISCQSAALDLAAVNGWQWVLRHDIGADGMGAPFDSYYVVSRDGCEGQARLLVDTNRNAECDATLDTTCLARLLFQEPTDPSACPLVPCGAALQVRIIELAP